MSSLIGVAIAVPDPHGAELERWRKSFGDPQADAIPAHVTLLPPTRVEAGEMPDVERHLERAASASQRFEVALHGTGTFRPVSPVVFVALSEGIASCERLAEAVRSGPLARAVEHPYHPHVTVAHDLPDLVLDRAFDELAEFRARFTVDALVLYEHVQRRWRAVRSFALAR
jgi:2'-5' RNA ligase